MPEVQYSGRQYIAHRIEGGKFVGRDVGSGEGYAVETRDDGVDSVVDVGPRPAVGRGILSASLQDQKQKYDDRQSKC